MSHSKEISINTRVARAILAGAIVFGNFACAPTPASPSFTVKSEKSGELKPEKDAGKEYILQSLMELPNSPMKESLLSKVVPLLTTPTPSVIELAGVKIPVHGMNVQINKLPRNEINGTILMRSNIASTEVLEILQDQELPVPYVDLVKPDEAISLNSWSNDVPYIGLTVKAGDRFYNGIKPEIAINTYTPTSNKPEDIAVVERLTKFTVVKEAATLMLYLLYVESIIQELQKQGINPEIEAKKRDGSQVKVEIATMSLEALTAYGGRILATVDIGGAVIAVHASKGMPVLQDIKIYDAAMHRFITAVAPLNLGTNAQDIRRNSNAAALTISDIPKVYQGDLNKIP